MDVKHAVSSKWIILRAISQVLCLPLSELLMCMPDNGWLAVVILVAQKGLR